MLLFEIQKSSIDETVAYIDHVKERALVGIRLGMRDGVRGLAEAEVEATAGHAPSPNSKDSDKLATILGKAGRVIETETEVVAVYQPRNRGKQPHYWLEYGAEIPAVERTLMTMQLQGDRVFRMGHKAFSLPPKPFFFTTAQAYVNEWFDKINARVGEALNA